jgi:hypothetical protein
VSPSKTPKQHRAMAAAAHGKSTLGIPKKVGQEFLTADKKKKKPAKQFQLPKKSRF